jgi:hypothetical protein
VHIALCVQTRALVHNFQTCIELIATLLVGVVPFACMMMIISVMAASSGVLL